MDPTIVTANGPGAGPVDQGVGVIAPDRKARGGVETLPGTSSPEETETEEERSQGPLGITSQPQIGCAGEEEDHQTLPHQEDLHPQRQIGTTDPGGATTIVRTQIRKGPNRAWTEDSVLQDEGAIAETETGEGVPLTRTGIAEGTVAATGEEGGAGAKKATAVANVETGGITTVEEEGAAAEVEAPAGISTEHCCRVWPSLPRLPSSRVQDLSDKSQ